MRKIILLAVVCTFIALSGLMIQQLLPSARTQERPRNLLSSGQEANISDQEFKAFAKVYVAYHKLQRVYGPSLRNARDSKEREKVQQEANSKLEKLLDKQGLTPEAYNRIFASVNSNDELRKKALELINEERSNS